MNISEYVTLDAIALAKLIATGELGRREAVEAALAMLGKHNPAINAVIARTGQAMEAALSDTRLANAPLAGVPYLIKDVGMHFAGVPMEMASALAQGQCFEHDTTLAKRTKATGLVTLGRTNLPELALGVTSEPRFNGPTRNPWNLAYSAGGSSGGSAAAVAARIVPMAHANDGGGSTRLPAACCGLFGLKATRGRLPPGPDVDEPTFGLASEHCVSRSVRDSALLLDLTCGADLGDRFLLPSPSRPYLQEVTTAPDRLRIGVTLEPPQGAPATTAVCATAVEEAARLLQGAGHELVEVRLGISQTDVVDVFLKLVGAKWSVACPDLARRFGREPRECLEATNVTLLEYGSRLTAGDLTLASLKLNRIVRTLAESLQEVDALLSPVTYRPPLPLGTSNADDPRLSAEEWIRSLLDFSCFTAPFNMSGQPAATVPWSWTREDLPIAIQLAGRFADEATLFRLAGQIEREHPWAQRMPAICG